MLLDNLLRFGGVLRGAGIDVHPGRLLDVLAALDLVDLASRDEVYHACRTLLVHSRDQIPVFDRAFAAFWTVHRAAADGGTEAPRPRNAPSVARERIEPIGGATDHDEGPDGEDEETPRGTIKIWSDAARLADRDFETLTAEELAIAAAVLSRLVWNPGERRTRRWVRGHGARFDLRRALADSRRTGGDVVTIARRTRRLRPRPLVLLCDISGSMERYSRMLLHFAHAVTVRQKRRVEAFLFATHLTRITRPLVAASPDAALAAVSRLVPDWSGGTRIGAALREFHQGWGRRALRSSAVVLLISDGWDCGDPAELRDQVARLQRSCHRLIWLNPLIGTVGYAPLTRGLQAALPFVDDFIPARTLNNLADLAVHLNTLM